MPHYRSDEWIIVWSSAPINHNVTIGTPFTIIDNVKITYKLIVEDSGHLNLYDALGIPIWTATQKNPHSHGYKFPEVYLVPTNFITPYDFDIHNSLNRAIVIRKDSTLYSLNKGCRFLKPNEALASPNERFKVFLESTGNLIIKDASRTMWESATTNLPFAKPPYQLVLNPTGNIMILDSNYNIIWLSIHNETDASIGPYQLDILDEGRLVVRDKKRSIVWESWPTNNMSYGVTFFKKIEYRFVHCHNRPPKIKYGLFSNQDNMLVQNELLKSENGKWEVLINNKKQLLLRSINSGKPFQRIIYDSEVEIKSLVLKESGQLLLLCFQNKTLWSSEERATKSNYEIYKLLIDNNGNLQVIDEIFDDILWSFPKPIIKDFIDDFEKLSINKHLWNIWLNKSQRNDLSKTEFYLILNSSLILKSELIQSCSLTSVNINTKRKNSLIYGKIEWKMKISSNDGMNYSFSLSPYNTNSSKKIYFKKSTNDNNYIFGINNGAHQIEAEFNLSNENEFHVFSLLWEPKVLIFYVDEEETLKICDEHKIPKEKMYIEIDVDLVESANISADLSIDYIKVNQYKKENKLKSSIDIYSYIKLENYFEKTEKSSINDCWTQCNQFSNCEAISFLSNICYLFDTNYTIKITNEKWTSMYKTCDLLNSSTRSYNIKLFNSINELKLSNSLICQKQCENDSKCIATSFKDDSCLFFDLNYDIKREPGWLSQISNFITNFTLMKTYHGIKFNSMPIKIIKTNNSKSCWNSCIDDFNCVSISINNEDECNLYGLEKLEFIKDTNWILFSFKSINTNNDYEYKVKNDSIKAYNPLYTYENMQLSNDFDSFENHTENSCLKYCTANEYCIGVSYFVNGTCQLSNSSLDFNRIDGWVSYTFSPIPLTVNSDNLSPLIYQNIKLIDSYKILFKTSGFTCWIEECLTDSNCSAVSYFQDQCFLYNSSYQYKEADGWLSFVTVVL